MSSRFDGCGVLAAIGNNPSCFPALKTDIDALARKLVVKQIKAASLDVHLIRKILATIGEPALRISFDGMGAKEIASVAHRLDPANAGVSTMMECELSDHICALGRGDQEPMSGKKVSARAPAKRPKKELSRIGEILDSKVHSGEPIKRAADARRSGPQRAKKGS